MACAIKPCLTVIVSTDKVGVSTTIPRDLLSVVCITFGYITSPISSLLNLTSVFLQDAFNSRGDFLGAAPDHITA